MVKVAVVRVEVDEQALRRAVNEAEGLSAALEDATQSIITRANALAAGMRTGIYHDHVTGERKGDTEPVFAGNVRTIGREPIGIVYTANYAAQKANLENNILLKAKG